MSDHVIQQFELVSESGAEGCRLVIKKLLARDNINVSELARRINLPQPTIHRLLNGKTEDPKLSTLSLIANYFSITLDQLLGNAPLLHESEKTSTLRSIPILSWQEAIKPEELIPTLSLTNWDDWLLIDIEASLSSFGLKSKKSMEPRFPTGSILVIDVNTAPDDGDLVIVCYPNTTEATIRELVLDGPNRALLSITDTSLSKNLTKDIKIIGVVLQTRFTYK